MSCRQDSGCFDESKEEDGSSSDACALSPLAHDGNLKINKHNRHLLQKEVEGIKKSLDLLRNNLIVQQGVLARDFEDRIRHVYDDVINDINSIRKCINSIGDTFDQDSKFKTWAPVMPFRKDILPSVYEIKASGKIKLKGSKSVDFVDQKGRESFEPFESDVFSKYQSKTTFCKRKSWLSSSRSSVSSIGSSRKSVAGFGQCFSGDGKTVPYRSYKALPVVQRNNRHSWGPSRTGSRSALDDDDDIDRGCLCGNVTEDWRAKVAPYMSEGSHVPGLEPSGVEKLRERYEQMENIRNDIVKVHNEYRQLHGCPELLVATDLTADAQKWADTLSIKGYAQYSDIDGRGENILVVDIADRLSGKQIADTWYRESKHYNYNKHRWQRGTSNFTQMIWKSSKVIGVGISKLPFHDTYIIVAQYIPSGNINTVQKFRQNVPPPFTSNQRPVSKSEDELSDADDVFYPKSDAKDVDKNFSVIITSNLKGLRTQKACSVKTDGAVVKPNGTPNNYSIVQPIGVINTPNHLAPSNENEDSTQNVINEESALDEIPCFNDNESEPGTALASVSASIVSSLNDLMKDDDIDREYTNETS